MTINNESNLAHTERPPEALAQELEEYSQVNSIVFKLPSFGWARKNYQNEYRSKVRNQLDEFNRSSCIPADVKERVRPLISQSIAQVQSFQAWRVIWNRISENLGIIGLIIGIIFSVLSAPIWSQPGRGILSWIAIIVSIITVLLVYLIFLVFFKEKLLGWSISYLIGLVLSIYWLIKKFQVTWLPKFMQDALTAAAIILILCTVLLIYFLLILWLKVKPMFWLIAPLIFTSLIIYWLKQFQAPWLEQLVQDTLIAGLMGGCVLLLFILILNLPGMFLFFLKVKLKVRRYAKEEIVQTLCLVLARVEFAPDQWIHTEFRGEVVYNLEWIHRRIKCNLYHNLSTKDTDTNTWLRNCMSEMAEYFRRLIQKVLLPQEKTREELIKDLASRLVDAAEGNWGKFKRNQAPPSRSLIRTTLHVLRSFLSLVFPFMIVVAVVFIPNPLSEQIKSTIVTVALGWGVLSLVILLDPKFERKVSAAKSLESIFKRATK